MALFKIFRGTAEDLTSVPIHDGYAYFTSDTGMFYIDVGDAPDGKRIPLNAKMAEEAIKLSKDDTTIEIDDLVLQTTLKKGEIGVGGDNKLTGLTGIGALYAEASGEPKFGALPIAQGGTGATNAKQARDNLSVYDKLSVDTAINNVTSIPYVATLKANDWIEDSGGYAQSISLTELRCGVNGNLPPVVTFTSNKEEYSKIESAEATPKTGIKFFIKDKPKEDIGIIVIDLV